MKFQIRRCPKCHRYTLRQDCKECNESTESAHPAKFSPDDRYLMYRLKERYLSKEEPSS